MDARNLKAPPGGREWRHRLARAVVAAGALALLAGCDQEDDAWKAGNSPDVTLTMALSVPGGSALHVGTTVRYILTVENHGRHAATSVVVADTLPDAVIFTASAASRGAYDPVSGQWPLEDLAPQTTATLTLTATVAGGTRGLTVVNAANVVATEPPDPTPAGKRDEVGFLVVNAPPVARPDHFELSGGATLRVSAPGVLGNDYDPEGEPLQLSPYPVDPPDHGLLTLSREGAFVYVHGGGIALADSFRYVIVDDSAAPDTGLVTISVVTAALAAPAVPSPPCAPRAPSRP